MNLQTFGYFIMQPTAEGVGFEPTLGVTPNMFSRHAPSAARPSLQRFSILLERRTSFYHNENSNRRSHLLNRCRMTNKLESGPSLSWFSSRPGREMHRRTYRNRSQYGWDIMLRFGSPKKILTLKAYSLGNTKHRSRNGRLVNSTLDKSCNHVFCR
jgi:hypothetical protein